jgi:7-cyano-7-deazaguanine synthase
VCSIVGAVNPLPSPSFDEALRRVLVKSCNRGQDSYGWREWRAFPEQTISFQKSGLGRFPPSLRFVHESTRPFAGVGTLRGEPATEWVGKKTAADIPPFTSPSGEWIFAHNGIVANDHEILEQNGYGRLSLLGVVFQDGPIAPTTIDSWTIGVLLDRFGWKDAVEQIKGSFALLGVHRSDPNRIWWATNYKPLYACRIAQGVIFASQRKYFDGLYDPWTGHQPIQLGPYAAGNVFVVEGVGTQVVVQTSEAELYPVKAPSADRTLVVCSGGLDSATVAYVHKKSYDQDVTLLHFKYGCRATTRETLAAANIANALDCELRVVRTDFFTEDVPSVLTDRSKPIAQGERGAELAYEWVPARNLVFASLALAIAEKDNYDCVAFGTNQEEGCAFVDNEQETYEKLRALVPFAVAPYRQIRIADPLGGMMKHEIVKVGARLGVPHQYTYSCYRGGEQHCGECGPCHQRRIAFRMAGVPDPTSYTDQVSSG